METKITYLGYRRDWDGLFELWVKIDDKEYTYQLRFERDLLHFEKIYRTGARGKALNYLKKVGEVVHEP